MSLFDVYVPGRSWLHRLDPRVKLWAVLLSFATAFMLPEAPAQLALLLGVHALLLTAGIPGRAPGALWRQLAPLLILILLLQPLVAPAGRTLVAVGPLRLTTGGLLQGLRFAARTAALAFVMAALLFTTDQDALVRALVRLGLPYTGGLTLNLTLRFIPTLRHLFVAVREAQAARGWTPEGNLFRRMRSYLPVLVAVVIGTLRISDRLTLALAARGLGAAQRGVGQRTAWHDLHMRPADWLTLLALTLAFTALLVWRVL
jgi:energy-coupling factor transport system permease protein